MGNLSTYLKLPSLFHVLKVMRMRRTPCPFWFIFKNLFPKSNVSGQIHTFESFKECFS